jgi:23S rRNA (adenine2503-C2)-methyltransferase
LLDANAEGLGQWMVEKGFPAYHAHQVFRWVFERRTERFESMTDVPKAVRAWLDREWTVFSTEVALHDVAPDGTDKLLLTCHDGRRIECVLMAESDRRTVCISTQVGCGMGCVFCASGMNGVERNLSSGEIIEQVLRLRSLLPQKASITNLVVMGMGESLANFDNLIVALDRICARDGLGLGQRRVTISTVGLPERMRELADLDRQYHLAVSLHAVMDAADAYFQKTGRQVTFEYVLLGGINDRVEDASALARLLSNRKAHANLIPYNPVAGLPYERPTPEAIRRFMEIVRSRGVSVTVRKTKGRAIDAACGQLRRRVESRSAVTLPSSPQRQGPAVSPRLS